MKKGKIITFVGFLVLLTALVVIPACAGFTTEQEKAQALSVNESQTQIVQQAQAIAAQNLALAKTASDEALARKYQQELEVQRAMLAGLQAQRETIVATPVGGTTNWEAGLSTLGGLFPPPFNAIVMLAGLVGSAVQTVRKKNSDVETEKQKDITHAVVNSIDVAKAADPVLDAAIKKNGAVIKAEQNKTNGAVDFVEASRI